MVPMNDDNLLLSPYVPSRADAVKNRALLLETAQRLFAEQGIDSVSMSAIAAEAGLGKGTLYRHFENKTQLCYALLDNDMLDLQERVLRRLQQQGSPYDNLAWFLEQVAVFIWRNKDLLTVRLSDDAQVSALGYPAHLWWRQTIRGLLQQINPTGDLEYRTDVLYVMLDPQTIRYQINMNYSLERIIDGLQSLLQRI